MAVGLALTVGLLGLLFLNLGRDPHAIRTPMVGRPAPSFTLPPVGGGAPVSLESLRGRTVVVNFWATWCVPCADEHPVLVQAARQLGSDVQFLGIVYEDEESNVATYLRRHGTAYPALVDQSSRTAIAYGVFGVPETYFVDAKGTIVAKHVGPLTPADLEAQLRKAQAPQVPQS
jgi:cytochrome c biogenesis protein CcmG, thiol:disulfide interchange protein DsbE